ncbi:IS66 family transposase [Saprospiraceae bacterium]|nr:IS66 family transposase [Saprospiraceae bacterium]MDB4539292.1 IS66 family transposase [Saprospiraceae bacterium]
MSKDEKISKLSTENLQIQRENERLKFENANLRRLIFNSKTERFVADAMAPNQGSLFAENTDNSEEEKLNATEEISYQRKKRNKNHTGRNKIPDHLPTREVIIEPEEDTTGMKKIGEEITETLEYTPASLVKKITRRPKYITADNSQIIIGNLPSRPIEKGIAEASLLTHIFIQKFIDHLPFYRQRQIFKRNYEWDLPSSTINDWFISCCTLLQPLYDLLVKKMLEDNAPRSYLQADESPIKVLDSEKKGSTHQGYQWIYRNPLKGIVVFQYRKGRGSNGPKEMLAGYQGYLQTDGYIVYDKIAKAGKIELVGCWAHARRKFFEALKFDKKRSEFVLEKIKTIYLHEKEYKDFVAEERKKYRLENVAPLMHELHTWAEEEQYKATPKSPISKAIGYYLNQWPKLSRVLQAGELEIDNNKIENKIRPLALGRKNYLFAGNHQAGQNIAMMYSFFATCKEHNINPYDWLKNVLEELPDTKITDLEKLLPQNWTAEFIEKTKEN